MLPFPDTQVNCNGFLASDKDPEELMFFKYDKIELSKPDMWHIVSASSCLNLFSISQSGLPYHPMMKSTTQDCTQNYYRLLWYLTKHVNEILLTSIGLPSYLTYSQIQTLQTDIDEMNDFLRTMALKKNRNSAQ